MFKVGDKVKVLSNSAYFGITGQVGEVVAVKTYVYRTPLCLVKLEDYPEGLHFEVGWIEKVKQNWFQKLFSR